MGGNRALRLWWASAKVPMGCESATPDLVTFGPRHGGGGVGTIVAVEAPVVVLAGGLGGARLALAFQAARMESETCVVTNVADDVDVDGLRVCPDTDAVLYAFAGCFDEDRGWGIKDDDFSGPAAPSMPWFHVGRRDAAHHHHRATLLAEGATPSEAAAELAAGLGVSAAVVPATDDTVRTMIETADGWRTFQEWLVRDHASSVPTRVSWTGASAARAAPGVLDAIARAELVILASSSPVASIGPTLALPGVRAALRGRRGEKRTVAISPVAARRPCATERDDHRARARAALLAPFRIDHSPLAIATLYAGLVDAFVLDPTDAVDGPAVEAMGVEAVIAPVVGGDPGERAELIAALARLG